MHLKCWLPAPAYAGKSVVLFLEGFYKVVPACFQGWSVFNSLWLLGTCPPALYCILWNNPCALPVHPASSHRMEPVSGRSCGVVISSRACRLHLPCLSSSSGQAQVSLWCPCSHATRHRGMTSGSGGTINVTGTFGRTWWWPRNTRFVVILPVGFIKQAGGLIVMVAELWMVKYFLPGRVVGRSYSRLSAPFPFCTKE